MSIKCRRGTIGRVELGVLGSVSMWEAGEPVALGPPRQCAVLAALMVDCGHLISVEVLVDRVWGVDAPERAPRTLHTYISRLRRLVGAGKLVRQAGGYVLEVEPDQVDLHRFRRLVAEAGNDTVAPAQRVVLLREAVTLWRGQPLAGICGDWAERMRRSWRQEQLDAMVSWARAELVGGDPTAVCMPLRELIDEHPLVEPLVEVLMRALATTGRTAEALHLYAAARERFADELGADPGPELQATHQALLQAGPPDQPPLPEPPESKPAVRPIMPSDTTQPERRRGVPLARHTARLLVAAAVAAALLALSVAVAPLLVASAPPAATVAPPPVWTARTTRPAPLFTATGQLLETVPVNATISVYCWFPGNPARPWLGDGIEYHVGYHQSSLVSGHIPDPYLAFSTSHPAGESPTGLRHCRPTSFTR